MPRPLLRRPRLLVSVVAAAVLVTLSTSGAVAMRNAIGVAAEMVERRMVDEIRDAIAAAA